MLEQKVNGTTLAPDRPVTGFPVRTWLSWGVQVVVAGILLQTLFFKFTYAPETQVIFGPRGGLRALSAEEFFARFHTATTSNIPDLKRTIGLVEYQVVGTVREGKDLAQVILRARSSDPKLALLSVLTMRRSGGVWKGEMTETARAAADALKETNAEKANLPPGISDTEVVPPQ